MSSLPVVVRDSSLARTKGCGTDETVSPAPGKRSCRVPGCRILHCKLRTHLGYNPAIYRHRDSQPTSCRDVSKNRGCQPHINANASIGRDGVDGMPALPIEHQSDQTFRALFHHFFDDIFNQLALLFRGPIAGGVTEYKQRMLSIALGSEAYCFGLIIHAQTDIDVARHLMAETEKSLVVYTSGLQAFRRQLIAVQTKSNPIQIEITLLTLCTILSYDICHGRNTSAMMHWKGLQQLVALRGGIQNVTVSLQYVVHFDRLCGQILNRPPAFTTTTNQNGILPMPLWSWYGSKFLTLNQGRPCPISSRIIDYCVDTCGLIGVWEAAKGDRARPLHNNVQPQPPSLEYLYRIRDRIDENFTVLHADLWGKRKLDKLVLWTTRILEYPYTWKNFVPTINSLHCGHLITYLQGQNLQTWTNETELLIWILFALAVVPSKYCGRDWVMKELRKVLTTKFRGTTWPINWQATELKNLQSFIWCDSQYNTRFNEVCTELEHGATMSVDQAADHVNGGGSSCLVSRLKENTCEANE